MATKTIAILNGKGGVGKTTTAMNLGSALWLMGKKVLLIDADSQCNLSIIMDETSLEPGVKNLYNWLEEDVCSLEEAPVYLRYDDFNFIPSSSMVEVLNTRLREKIGGEKYLKRRLDVIKDSGAFDFIIIDCPPSVNSMITVNVLVASDEVLVPTRADYFGIQGLTSLKKTLKEIRESEDIELPLIGFMLTQYENTKAAREIQEALDEMGVEPYPVKIRKCVACTAAQPRQMSLFEYDPSCTAADDYMTLAEKICGKKRNPEKSNPKVWRQKVSAAYEKFIRNQQSNEEEK